MSQPILSPQLADSIEIIKNFIESVTDEAATDEELSDAFKRYFVLNEIREHIEMIRDGKD